MTRSRGLNGTICLTFIKVIWSPFPRVFETVKIDKIQLPSDLLRQTTCNIAISACIYYVCLPAYEEFYFFKNNLLRPFQKNYRSSTVKGKQ